MPQCPHCQAPYEKGQRYCSVCGSFLLHPEEKDTFCPQCGVRVSPKQEFCHECDAPLKGEAAAALQAAGPGEAGTAPPEPATPPESAAAAPKKMQPWIIWLLIGAGIAIIVLMILLFTQGTPPPPPKAETPAPTAPAPQAVTPAPPTAAPGPEAGKEVPPELKAQLAAVLSSLREGQLHKDIVKFMSVYSLTFPDLEKKRADALKSWEYYDYTNLVFTIDKVQPIDPDNVMAWVTWYIDTRNRQTQELASSTQTYQVRFVKELGKWRIRSLQEAEEQ
jgi:hypothetical protein